MRWYQGLVAGLVLGFVVGILMGLSAGLAFGLIFGEEKIRESGGRRSSDPNLGIRSSVLSGVRVGPLAGLVAAMLPGALYWFARG